MTRTKISQYLPTFCRKAHGSDLSKMWVAVVGGRQLRIQKRLGNGAFGVVYKVKDVASSREYALKDILCTNTSEILKAIGEAMTLNQSHVEANPKMII